MNEDILKEYELYLRGEYPKNRSVIAYYKGIEKCLSEIGKNYDIVTKDDLNKWKITINKNKSNSVRTWIVSVNKFFKWMGEKELKLNYPNPKKTLRICFSNEERQKFLESAKEYPEENLICLLSDTAILRPDEINNIKISNIDRENHKILLDETAKTGQMFAFINTEILNAIDEYMKVRPKLLPSYEDYLLINGYSRGKGKKYTSTNHIRTVCRKVALRAGIKKTVTPYKTVKPSAITLRLNDKVNIGIVQRMARHTTDATTQLYNHPTNDDVYRYLESEVKNIDYEQLTEKSKAEMLLEKYLNGEIDKTTFSNFLEVLKPQRNENEQNNIGYV